MSLGLTTEQADEVVRLLKLDGDVDEYENRLGHHLYFLDDGNILRVLPSGLVQLTDSTGARLAHIDCERVDFRKIRYWRAGKDMGTMDFSAQQETAQQ